MGFWDADLATPFSELPAFVEVLEEHPEVDVVVGSRVKLMGRTIERRAMRHYLGRVFATAASLALELPVTTRSAGEALPRDPGVRRVFEAPFLARWVFDVELLARVLAAHPGGPAARQRSSTSCRSAHWADVHGSKLKPSDFVKAAIDLAMIRVRYRRQRPSRA